MGFLGFLGFQLPDFGARVHCWLCVRAIASSGGQNLGVSDKRVSEIRGYLRLPLKGYYKGSFKGLERGLEFPKLGVPYFGVLIMRILLFGVLY